MGWELTFHFQDHFIRLIDQALLFGDLYTVIAMHERLCGARDGAAERNISRLAALTLNGAPTYEPSFLENQGVEL